MTCRLGKFRQPLHPLPSWCRAGLESSDHPSVGCLTGCTPPPTGRDLGTCQGGEKGEVFQQRKFSTMFWPTLLLKTCFLHFLNLTSNLFNNTVDIVIDISIRITKNSNSKGSFGNLPVPIIPEGLPQCRKSEIFHIFPYTHKSIRHPTDLSGYWRTCFAIDWSVKNLNIFFFRSFLFC